MQRKQASPADLDHVLYEIEMLSEGLKALHTRSAAPGADHNAWIESFAIHARNLNDFFGKKPRGGYMKPDHFVKDWGSYAFEKKIERRASNQIAHLTYDREGQQEKTRWPAKEFLNDLRKPCLSFLKAVAKVDALMAYDKNKQRTEALIALLIGKSVTAAGPAALIERETGITGWTGSSQMSVNPDPLA
jgi:hypothetical protein